LTKVQQLQTQLSLPLSNAAPGVETYEIILEANYHINLYPGLYLMPDLHYIIRPSAASTYPNAWVIGFRASALF
jgi:carbohydrate-selective porin OprB